jgi:hypothetical protein
MIAMRTRSGRAPPTLTLTLVLALAAMGCTTGGDDSGSTASVEDVSCPPEISVQALVPLTCSFVTVPQDRSEPDGAKVRLFVIRIEPEAQATGIPIVYVGGAIGTSFDYRNLFDVAGTLPGHELIAIELRGTGHSEPNLSCPEVDALAGRARAESVADTQMRRAFMNAVASCRARIASRGIDPAAFDVPESAADVLDVVGALRLSEWEMLSKGSTSRVVFEAMRAEPPVCGAWSWTTPSSPRRTRSARRSRAPGPAWRCSLRRAAPMPSADRASPTWRTTWTPRSNASRPTRSWSRTADNRC